MPLQRVAWISLLFSGVAVSGINWKSVWLEPRTPVVLTVGEAKPYTVIGRNGADVKADLTKSPYLKITSSDAEILEVNPQTGTFVGKKPGHVDIQIAFSDATEMVPAFVRPSKTGTAAAISAPSNDIDGVWKAVFTGDLGERPKMVSEIVFALDSSGNALSGVVHAAYWPGDAAVSDGKVDGDRITFTMIGQLPFNANGVTGYPKLCFTGVRSGDEMKIDLLWTEARNACTGRKSLAMAGKKVAD
jgi:hypothetical protein